MVIIITFKLGNEVIKLKIENREIYYSDRLFQNMIRLIPPDGNFLMKIRNSRNKIPAALADLFVLTNSEILEYENCKTDIELEAVCIKDIEKKGGKIISIIR